MKERTKTERIFTVIFLFIFLFASRYIGIIGYLVISLIFLFLYIKKQKSEYINEGTKQDYKKLIKYYILSTVISIVILLIFIIFDFFINK